MKKNNVRTPHTYTEHVSTSSILPLTLKTPPVPTLNLPTIEDIRRS